MEEIDFESEVQGPLAEFDSVATDTSEIVDSWRRTTCEQGLIYREEQRKIVDACEANTFICRMVKLYGTVMILQISAAEGS